MSAIELLDGYRRGASSPVDVVESTLERVAEREPDINALTTLTSRRARRDARAAAARYGDGSARPLEGVPVVIKDLLDTEGVRTTYGSALFAEHVPASETGAVARLREAGAMLIGKAATHEFGWGITTASDRFGATRNPWALDRVPGGSSGGSAAALAAGYTPLALGSDTGGSIRMPAAFCGVVGFKPTFGRVPTQGAFALAPSLDHVGPMARTPADTALLFSTIAGGVASRDPGSWIGRLTHAQSGQAVGLRGVRIGVCSDLHAAPLADDVRPVFERAVMVLADLGAQLVEVDVAGAESYDALATVLLAEALAEHRRRGLLPARRGEYGTDVQARIEIAESLTPAAVAAARADRRRLGDALRSTLARIDVMITPAAAGPPALHDRDTVLHDGADIEFRRLVMPYVTPQSVAGAPACVVRAGFDALGIPVGVQLSAAAGADERVLETAAHFYGATLPIQRRWPTGLPVAGSTPTRNEE